MKAFGETLDDERKEREKEANKAAKKKNKKDGDDRIPQAD